MYYIVTSRFNNQTRDSNYNYRKKNGYSCIYCSPSELSCKIPYNTPVFVVEMNNTTNNIEGIGLIKNNPETQKYYKVHLDGNNNRYIYIGNYFIEREIIDNYNEPLLNALEEILFKGKSHSKRGGGLSLFPESVLKLDICQGINIKREIRELFIYHFRDKLKR
jgi:hypothetical protein